MEKSMKRAIRRHHVQRLKKSRAGYFVINWWPEEATPRRLGIISQYPKMCSCMGCGNPRKWWKEKTLSEYRSYDILRDGLKSIAEDGYEDVYD